MIYQVSYTDISVIYLVYCERGAVIVDIIKVAVPTFYVGTFQPNDCILYCLKRFRYVSIFRLVTQSWYICQMR